MQLWLAKVAALGGDTSKKESSTSPLQSTRFVSHLIIAMSLFLLLSYHTIPQCILLSSISFQNGVGFPSLLSLGKLAWIHMLRQQTNNGNLDWNSSSQYAGVKIQIRKRHVLNWIFLLGIRDGALQISLLRFRHTILIHNLFEENLSSTIQEMCFQKEKSQGKTKTLPAGCIAGAWFQITESALKSLALHCLATRSQAVSSWEVPF